MSEINDDNEYSYPNSVARGWAKQARELEDLVGNLKGEVQLAKEYTDYLKEQLDEMTDNHRVTSELFEAHLEECRLNGMGAQRELKLMTELNEANNLIETLKVHAADRRDLFRGFCKKQRELKDMLEVSIEALENIADPRKRDHNEPDAYTTLGCVMNIADGALTKLKG